MALTLVDVAGGNFRTEEDADELNNKFMQRLGIKSRFIPARLAIARSLAAQGIPPAVPYSAEMGKAIKGDTLFGTGANLSTWIALITQKNGGNITSLKDLLGVVAAHWARGLSLLDTEWGHAEGQEPAFVRRLVEVAGLPMTGGSGLGGPLGRVDFSSSPGPIPVPIGEVSTDATTKTFIEWVLNGPGGSPHSAIMGGVGSGKTRTAVAMLKAIRKRSNAPFLAFDFKGDLGTDADGKGYALDKVFGATVIQPPRTPIPLNVLALRSTDDMTLSEDAMRFRDSFGRLKGSTLGAKQRTAVFDAAQTALRTQHPCELHHIRDALQAVYAQKNMPEDGATSALEDICRFPLFSPTLSPAEFFSKSWIIRLPQEVPEASRSLVVNLMLDALDTYLNSLPDAPMEDSVHRSLRMVCVIDEAHRILGSKLPSLSNLIRMSRSKGGAIMLISQSPDDFSGEDDEFLSEMGLVGAFASNARPNAVTKIFGKGVNLSKLVTGQCVMKMRGEDAARKVVSWQR
ncbi:DUF1832 domain-containing protein [Methylobacterium mesophilicum SR1.6/6]|uniref:DUF1832 domain-containing protein n=1 Tax=Methylobacterium mesophilicum SR1.6/6 TaxID=908290 RepID=A0A6B9FQL4_9HYPH|nr:DndE family protein [Methylobacterium mesophilicum]QGY03255.1 DUF1832 domain-containing protein [Methylobacterium mesophilicum SR1.6/6]